MKIIIADDHAVVRSGFMHILNFKMIWKSLRLLRMVLKRMIWLRNIVQMYLLMDLSMPPGESGLIATGKIKEDFPETKILILTMHDDEEYLFHVLKNGASGYVLKNAPDEELLAAIRTVYAGGTYIHPSMATSLVREFVKNDTGGIETDPFKILTKREIEVLPLAAKGYGNKEIAEKLYISVKTVEAHKSRIMEKLQLKNRPELVEYALRKKFLNF